MRANRRRRLTALLFIAVLFVGWGVYDYLSVRDREMPVNDQAVVAVAQQNQPQSVLRAVDALGQLAVREAASHAGYSREQFGDGWAEADGCDMRNRILQRDLARTTLDEDNCTVLSGVLENDPYTGGTIQFMRGRTTSSAVQIDHVVALSDSWSKGAQDLSREQRIKFANDPLNLLAVDGPSNMQKGDASSDRWLPQAVYRCRYVARQIAVKLKYHLWVTLTEQRTMQRTLNSCTNQLLPIEESSR